MTTEPLYEKWPPDPPDKPRLLLATYHFPPGASVGALRWRKLSSLLAEEGWGLDVITTSPGAGVDMDETAAADLPSGIRIWPVSSPEPAFHRPERVAARLVRGLTRWLWSGRKRSSSAAGGREGAVRANVRWNLSSPRGYLRLYFTAREAVKSRIWSRRITGLALQVIEPGRHRAVITSGPPHSWHLAGRHIAERTGLGFVMDLRDPWSTCNVVHDYFATPAWFRMSRAQEAKAVRRAELIVANTDALREEMAAAFPDAADRMLTVMNGIDEDPLPPTQYSPRFTISYLGSVYRTRDPQPFFSGAAAAIRDLGLTPDDLAIRMVGDVQSYGGTPTTHLAEAAGIGEFLHLTPRVARAEALRIMATSQVLLSLPWEDRLSVPAKLFEYMRFHAWILMFAYPGSAVEALLRGKDADLVTPDDVQGVTEALERRYTQFQRGERPRPLADERFSRRYQAGRLASALAALTPRDAAALACPTPE